MVKHKYKILLSIILLLCNILFVNCQKSSINGDLDGRWQILEIEIGDNIKYVKDDQLYYNFYLHVCNLTFYGGIFTVGNLKYENDQIYMDFPYINTPNGRETLQEYGIYSNPVEFKIFYLDKKKLVMGNDESTITLRKF